ncbi:MAG: Guanine/hypoxanthine permease PbuG [Tenericutes bacterium ADurb.Bin087]|nr:MAG: Guanine/hypoxanthine permease PbuG [Tenericutes bacterium ADurb.Bin087]
MKNLLNKLFKFEARKANLTSEILGGLVTFLAMIYILPTNAGILSDMGMDASGVFVATAIVSAIVSLVMGLYGNFPIVLSAGMGVNAYLAYVVYGALGSWQAALLVMFFAGIVFAAISLSPLRKMMIDAIPNDIKYIISAGLGAFIAFVGFKSSGFIVASPATLVSLGNLRNPMVLLSLFGVLLVVIFMFSRNKRLNQLAIPIAMVIVVVVSVAVWNIFSLPEVTETGRPIAFHFTNIKNMFTDPASWGGQGFEKVVFKIFDKETWGTALSNPSTYAFIFSLILVNLFDTTATILAIGRGAGIIDADGKMVGGHKVVAADAFGAVICAPLGTSTVTSFSESGIAVEMGAKTGLAAVVAGFMFLLSAFIYPIFYIFTEPAVTSMALITVGGLIFVGNLKDVNFEDRIIGFTAFFTIMLILLTYSISDGLGLGLIVYVIMMLVSRRGKEVKIPMYVVAGVFVIYFILKAFV